MDTYKLPTITEIKKEAKANGIEIKKSNSYLNGKEAWELPNGKLMTKKMLQEAYCASELF